MVPSFLYVIFLKSARVFAFYFAFFVYVFQMFSVWFACLVCFVVTVLQVLFERCNLFSSTGQFCVGSCMCECFFVVLVWFVFLMVLFEVFL